MRGRHLRIALFVALVLVGLTRAGRCPLEAHNLRSIGSTPMPATMSIAQLNTLYSAAVAAIDDADYDLAIRKLMAVKARLATMPNVSRNLPGGGTQSITFNPAQLDSLITQCRQLKASAAHATSGPFRQTKITYARPDNVDAYA